MGVTGTVRTQVISKQDMKLQLVNHIAISGADFEAKAKFFPVGTIFEDKGQEGWKDMDSDSYDTPLHGWCYIKGYGSDGQPLWDYCNFHGYILDHWTEYPELFESYE